MLLVSKMFNYREQRIQMRFIKLNKRACNLNLNWNCMYIIFYMKVYMYLFRFYFWKNSARLLFTKMSCIQKLNWKFEIINCRKFIQLQYMSNISNIKISAYNVRPNFVRSWAQLKSCLPATRFELRRPLHHISLFLVIPGKYSVIYSAISW